MASKNAIQKHQAFRGVNESPGIHRVPMRRSTSNVAPGAAKPPWRKAAPCLKSGLNRVPLGQHGFPAMLCRDGAGR